MADQARTARIVQRPVKARPPRFNSLVAAAAVMTAPGRVAGGVDRTKPADVAKWQGESWGYYDRVGEFRRGVGWLSNGMSRVNIVAARPPQSAGDEPMPIELATEDNPDDQAPIPIEKRAVELVEMIAGGAVGQGEMMRGFGEHLSIAGICWLVVEPDLEDPEADTFETWLVLSGENVERKSGPVVDGEQTWIWRVRYESADWRDAHPNALIVKCWRKHPRRPWEPDAPVRALLPVLNQIEILSESITASGTSRLAGAGILAIPSEATFPQIQTRQPAQDVDPDNPPPPEPEEPTPGNADLFIETFIASATVPIRDRSSAAAYVPLVIQIPGEHLTKIQHIAFAMPLDQLVGDRLEAAIRRFATGMDMPAEALLGVADANHWTAWQIAESGITLHIEPMSESCVEALTDGYLIPALVAEGYGEDVARAAVMVWYDTTDLRTRPDKSASTTEAYKLREASGKALRREMGLDDTDAPDDDEKRERILLDAMAGLPSLGPLILEALGYLTSEQVAAFNNQEAQKAEGGPGEPEPSTPTEPENSPPTQPTEPPDETPEPPPESAHVLLAACDGVVYRALERSGARLKSAAGRKVHDKPSVLDGDPTRLHCSLDATVYADLDFLLDGAWTRVPEIAARYGVDPEALTATLVAYTRSLLAAAHPHTVDRLAHALGVDHRVLAPA